MLTAQQQQQLITAQLAVLNYQNSLAAAQAALSALLASFAASGVDCSALQTAWSNLTTATS